METLVITLGYKCNFRCEHCIVGKKTEIGLTEREKELIAESVCRYGTKHVLFVGGEPTLYVEDMNDIISRFEAVKPELRMTTNGHFAQTREKAMAVLESIPKLSGVNLSYDSLHAKFLPEKNIENLYSACKEKGLDFAVLMALRSPMDLVMLKGLRKIGGFKVWIQKLLPAGSARDNGLGYKYPSFNEQVLAACCPTRKKVIYMCGQGFTICCSGPRPIGSFFLLLKPFCRASSID